MKHLVGNPSRVAFLLATAISFCGCSSDDDDDFVVAAPNEILISSEHGWFSGTEFYDWDTTATVARVEYRVRSFHHGNCRVRVFDSLGKEIHDVLYWFWDSVYVIGGGDEYLDIRFTGVGVPGRWTIRLDFLEFSGHLYLTLEDNLSPPPPDPVPTLPPVSSILNPAFGGDGIVTFSQDRSFGVDVAVDSANRVVVAGTIVDSFGNRRLAVWRFLSTGQPDSLFGTDGLFVYNGSNSASANGVAIDSLNRIVVCGWRADTPTSTLDTLVLRLGITGFLDPTFGFSGASTFDNGIKDDIAHGVDFDSTGRILLSGTSRAADNSTGRALVLRYVPSGLRDVTFNGTGFAQTTDDSDRGARLIVDSSDRPVVTGERDEDLAVWRFTTAGAADLTFGTAGVALGDAPLGEIRFGISIARRSGAGDLAVAGFRKADINAPIELAVWDFDSGGTPDTGFAGSGYAFYPFAGGQSIGTDLRFDALGRLLVVGVTRNVGGTEDNASASIWRISTAGALDGTFGTAGLERFDIRTDNVVTAGFAMDEDGLGNILVSGGAANLGDSASDLTVWSLSP